MQSWRLPTVAAQTGNSVVHSVLSGRRGDERFRARRCRAVAPDLPGEPVAHRLLVGRRERVDLLRAIHAPRPAAATATAAATTRRRPQPANIANITAPRTSRVISQCLLSTRLVGSSTRRLVGSSARRRRLVASSARSLVMVGARHSALVAGTRSFRRLVASSLVAS